MKFQIFISLVLFNFLNAIQLPYKNDPYGTHQPVLYEIATNTVGPIIEFGSGNGSTDLLHEICKTNQRLLITLDDNLEWLNRYKKKYSDESWHKFYFVPGKYDDLNPDHWIKFLDNFDLLQKIRFEVCFIDQSPWLARYETLKRLKDSTIYIIVHDCDFFPTHNIFGKLIQTATYNVPGIFDFSDQFKYFKIYYPSIPWPGHSGPPTLLGSNFEKNLPDIDYNKY